MTNRALYKERIKSLTQKVKKEKRLLHLIAFVKLLIFSCLIFFLYQYVADKMAAGAIVALGCLLVFIILSVFDTQRLYRHRLLKELITINKVELNSLDYKFDDLPGGEEYICDKHHYSSDLDLFGKQSLFQFINRTTTMFGKDQLASWLMNTNNSSEEILLRQAAIMELEKRAEWRQVFQGTGKVNQLGNLSAATIEKWVTQPTALHKAVRPLIWGLFALNLMLIIAGSLSLAHFFFPVTISLFNLCFVFFQNKKIMKEHKSLDGFIKAFTLLKKLIDLIEKEDFSSQKLHGFKAQLFNGKKNATKAFKQISRVLDALDQRGNVIVSTFFNALFLRDIHLILSIERWKKEYAGEIPLWMKIIGEIDALNSVANYGFNNNDFVFPLISEHDLISAKELGHPLIKRKTNVKNDFQVEALHQFSIVTGANMAGKSTFLRTLGVNYVLAAMGARVCASAFAFQPLTLFSSMRTGDNLADETSYFHAELLRLKQLIDIARKEAKVFIILDEILKGTNSVDKLTGSRKFITKLLEYPVAGLVATHDLALGELEEEHPRHFHNICFEIDINGNEIHYSYKLQKGISKNMNATLLMKNFQLI